MDVAEPYEKQPVRIGRLKLMALSPAHFRHAEENESTAMTVGTALHQHYLLKTPVTVCPMRRDERTKAYQEWSKEHSGELVLSETEARHVRGMAEALDTDRYANDLLVGKIEETRHWEWMGRACRGTHDADAAHAITELKTSRCSQPDWFWRDASKRGYDTQLVWYEQGIPPIIRNRELWIVAVESKPPYAVTCHRMTNQRREQAARQIRIWFERLLQCEQASHWPAYTEAPVDWDVSSWQEQADADDIDEEALA
jgi:hypothetical protein